MFTRDSHKRRGTLFGELCFKAVFCATSKKELDQKIEDAAIKAGISNWPWGEFKEKIHRAFENREIEPV